MFHKSPASKSHENLAQTRTEVKPLLTKAQIR